ncbi:MAG: hypothetical protein VKK04_23005 [Synechococcales bacterium]|nr:hypothetical protein [Synechococcales bacterium]
MSQEPLLFRFETILAADDGGDVASYPVRLWRYGGDTDGAIAPGQDIILLIHGRRDDPVDRDRPISELYPRFHVLATELAQTSTAQVFFLDWSEAATDGDLPPTDAAARVRPVADWAAAQLQTLQPSDDSATSGTIRLIGHSLGSYIASETAQQLGTAADVVALDPAFPVGDYDLDGLEAGDQLAGNLKTIDPESLAFVVADSFFGTGIAGDNAQAGTAQTSFILDLAGLGFGLFGAVEAHLAAIDVYADFSRYLLPGAAVTNRLLAAFPTDRYDNRGDRQNGLHEGVAHAERDGEDIWRLERIDGDGVDLYFVKDEGVLPRNTDGGLDTVVSLVSFTLEESFENLVLGGTAELDGTGNDADNFLQGNDGRNRLAGLGGDDLLYGEAGSDRLEGGEGGDELWGGEGTDLLVGGLGQDVFMLEAASGRDTIADFEDGVDFLGLAADMAFADLRFRERPMGTVIRWQNTAVALLVGVEVAALDASDLLPVAA